MRRGAPRTHECALVISPKSLRGHRYIMKEIVGMALALVLLGVQGGNIGDCVDGKCFVVQHDGASFVEAQHVCQEKGGHLMTVRDKSLADVLARLLNGASGNFWLGLRYDGDKCSDFNNGLKGYQWITGDNTSLYNNWRSDLAVCSPRCVSVSQKDHKWTERPCSDRIEGYLCEYVNSGHCQPLSDDEQVFYSTHFGFTANELLQEVPQYTNATKMPLRTRHFCYDGSWLQAPWSCEVFGGGCDYKCEGNACRCQTGFKLDKNGVTCSQQDDDPCAHAGCEHGCLRVGSAFKCTCPPEVTLSADGKSCEDCKPGFHNETGVCVDVDECEPAPCEHDCINTEGSYYCKCFDGHIPSKEDMHKCKMHCAEMRCPAECDPNNNAQCNCPDGFLLEDDKYCVDLDECISTNNCDQGCTNTPGDYECYCEKGYVLLENGRCVEEDPEGSGSSTPFDMFTPTSRPPSRPPTDKPLSISAGSLLGVMVCIVACVLLLVCLVYCILRRLGIMNNYDMHKGHDEIYDFQQVITENNSTQQSLPNRNLKRDI